MGSLNGGLLTLGAVAALAVAGEARRGSGNETPAPHGALRALLAQHAALVGRGVGRSRRALGEAWTAEGVGHKARIVGGAWVEGASDAIKTSVRTLPSLLDLAGSANRPDAYKIASDRFYDALEAVAGEKQVVYLGPFIGIGDRKGGILGNLELSFRNLDLPTDLPSDALGVHLAFIGVPKETRRQGRGRRLLELVCEAADAVGMRIDLDVDPQRMVGDTKAPVGKAQLRVFYTSLGFAPVRGMGPDYLVRRAR